MYYRRKDTSNNNNINGGACCASAVHKGPSSTTTTTMHSNNKLFQPGVKLIIRRAPIITGVISVGLTKKFQRPMLKRRAYDKNADVALKQCTLGPRKRMNGMAKIMSRAGKGLSYKAPNANALQKNSDNESGSDNDDDDEKEEDRPFEPLCLWISPHQTTTNAEDGENEEERGNANTSNNNNLMNKGLPSRIVTITREDEYGVEEQVQVLQPAPLSAYAKDNVLVPTILTKWLRPHQREGVQFMYECVMGLRGFKGNGCILADDMGLGKTLQSVSLIYTLLNTGITVQREPTCKRVIVICPCSLVKNWENEFVKWLGPGAVKTLALAEADRKTVEKNIDCFVKTKLFNILIASYECIRTHINRLIKHDDCCDLLVCDEAHRLKNSDNQTSRALQSIPVKRRVLLTGTPMQNDLQEFYAMVDFTNPGILGTPEEFRRKMLFPILRGREPEATDSQKRKMLDIQQDMSNIVGDFILRRINTLNAQHLPPKLVQVVCCKLTEIQHNMYQHLVQSKDMQHVLDGKQVNCLSSIQMLMKLCNHPSLIAEEDKNSSINKNNNTKTKRSAASKTIKYNEDEKESTLAPGADGVAKFLPYSAGEGGGGGGRRGDFAPIHPEWSGKMFVLYRLMKEMRKPGNGADKIVIVSNYTQTLDLIGRMCRENSWGFCRLDGSITMKKRQKMVDEFNDPTSSLVAFLLSSKAGGCGLNLIGGNRLVLFDPDWNPAVDKQAAARCWRDGQKKRCFTYRFLTAGTVEEKIFQRQLSKEGLQSVVDDKEQVNALSTKDLRNLFKLRQGTPSDTHDKLRCERCEIIHDNAEMEALKVLPKKLAECQKLLEKMQTEDDAKHFLKPLDATEHGKTKEEYEKIVKQPMDFGTIATILAKPQDQPSAYKSVSTFSKDVNRVFANVLKLWNPGDEIADAARRLQGWWTDQWKDLVPRLMTMKADDDDSGAKPADDADSGAVEDGSSANMVKASAYVNNERGEDYQEQIGMPDEENMRHWSHHYSTDTVDDPVFRAAMRGYDSVSFVFGLEVTWSLIQERQQEEEERIAMEALQCIQEEGDEDGDDAEKETGDSDCKKPAAVEAKEDESSAIDDAENGSPDNNDNEGTDDSSSDDDDAVSVNNNAEEVDIDMVEESEHAKPAVNADLAESSESEPEEHDEESSLQQAAADDCSTEDLVSKQRASPGAESLADQPTEDEEAELDFPTTNDNSEQDEDDDYTMQEDNPSGKENEINVQQQQKQPPQVVAGQWQCTSCTFLNTKSSLRKCLMCNAKKPPAAAAVSSNQTQQQQPPRTTTNNNKKKRDIQELSI